MGFLGAWPVLKKNPRTWLWQNGDIGGRGLPHPVPTIGSTASGRGGPRGSGRLSTAREYPLWWYKGSIPGHYGVGPDDCTRSNRHATHDQDPVANPDVMTDDDSLDVEEILNDLEGGAWRRGVEEHWVLRYLKGVATPAPEFDVLANGAERTDFAAYGLGPGV